MPKKNAVAQRLEDLDLSFEKAARYLAERGVEISGSYLSTIAKGREPALPLARKLATALELELSDIVKL